MRAVGPLVPSSQAAAQHTPQPPPDQLPAFSSAGAALALRPIPKQVEGMASAEPFDGTEMGKKRGRGEAAPNLDVSRAMTGVQPYAGRPVDASAHESLCGRAGSLSPYRSSPLSKD